MAPMTALVVQPPVRTKPHRPQKVVGEARFIAPQPRLRRVTAVAPLEPQLRTNSALRVGQSLLAGALVPSQVGFACPRHSRCDCLHLL